VELRVARIGRTSFTLDYRFVDGEGQVRASARTIHVHSGSDRQSGAPLPQALAAALSDWLCQAETR
jgi:acyl-CoA thioesterase FadM